MDAMVLQLIKTLSQRFIGIGISFVNSSQPCRPDLWCKSDKRFRPGKGLFERFDKMNRRKSKGFKEAFHPKSLFTDAREKVEIIFGFLGIGIKANVEGLIPIGDCFFDRLENLFDPSERNAFSSGDDFLR
jgi:hypothetical protein